MSVYCSKCGTENPDTLNFCSSCGSVLFSPSINDPLAPGIILEHRYKIIKLVKTGSMGAIYQAIDTKFETICAVKELLPNFDDPQEQAEATEWFKREARLLNKLDHPNLPKVFDYFISKGRYYLVMTFIEGDDLEAILEEYGNPGLPLKEVIDWTKEILDILIYLHNHEPPIIYRDIKPSNIMIHSDGRATLVDFGIARTIKRGGLTQKTAIGTPGYTPIEQCSGQAEPRSDLFAMGATMHHLISGVQPIPFKFDPLIELVPSVPPEINHIIMKALAHDVKDRLGSAKEMLALLSSPNKMEKFAKECEDASRKRITSPLPPKPEPVKPRMELIPEGSFQMGSSARFDSKTPFHKVTLESFYMSKYAVTNKEYCIFLNYCGNETENNVKWIYLPEDAYCGIKEGPEPDSFRVKSGYKDRPAVYVTWYGAVAYCNWLSEKFGLALCYGSKDNRGDNPYVWRTRLGYRLPTEAEWEYACRGRTETLYYWGDNMDEDYCWYMGNSSQNHRPAGEKKANNFGLYDMSGNIYEWCNDWFGNYLPGTVSNPTGPIMGACRVVRGGNWHSFPGSCQSGYRLQEEPSVYDNGLGFRLVRTR